jgi:hypothetical protein
MSRALFVGYALLAIGGVTAIALGATVLYAHAGPAQWRPLVAIALGVPLVAFAAAAARDEWGRRRRAPERSSSPRAARSRVPGAVSSLGSLPADAPKFADKPLPWHMTASRKHLPSTLPARWSVPLALAEMGGIWMIDVEDFAVLVAYTTVGDRIMLAVTIVPPPGDEVTETFALAVLKHLRGVREFVPSDIADKVQGARMYLGSLQVDRSAGRSALN